MPNNTVWLMASAIMAIFRSIKKTPAIPQVMPTSSPVTITQNSIILHHLAFETVFFDNIDEFGL